MNSSIADLLREGRQGVGLSGQIGSFVQGIVTENNDKNFPAMVKVEFTSWLSGKNICEWIPLLHPYAGAAYGCYLLPEIGDVVLVGFLGAAQTKPFVLGCFYPAGAKILSESFDEKNLKKRFITKGGVECTVSDEKDKQSVLLTTPKGLKLTIEDETEQVAVSDKDGKNLIRLDCKNGAIEITADKTIALKVGKCEITLDGQGGAIAIKGDKLTLEAAQTAKLAGNQSLTLEGGMLKAEGKQTAALKGGTMTEISGQMLKLN